MNKSYSIQIESIEEIEYIQTLVFITFVIFAVLFSPHRHKDRLW